MKTEHSAVLAAVSQAFRKLNRRLWLRRSLRILAAVALLAAVLSLLAVPSRQIAAAAVLLVAVLIARFALSRHKERIGLAGFAQHLDRCFPQLEESSALLLAEQINLSPLQRMQRRRTESAIEACLAQERLWLTPVRPGLPILVVILCSLVIVFAPQLLALISTPHFSPTESGKPLAATNITVANVEARISPPAYTALEVAVVDQLDLQLIEGSTVEWRLEIDGPEADYALVFAAGEALPLDPLTARQYSARRQISQTGLYRLVTRKNGHEYPLGGIHTLTVRRDNPPRIRIEEPRQTTLEIARLSEPVFESIVSISDDFGPGPVDIRASVAKGSGEGVKFRDEIFMFDSQIIEDDRHIYRRVWNLSDIGMEPGDELYFFVTAQDNRQPEPNLARSETVIVRWLDEAGATVDTEGLAIDRMPEYFKSQRQIIIETEQLLADREALDPPTFDATSRALGQAQGDLKQRYGQYLGDEFGESEAPESLLSVETEEHHEEHEDPGESGPVSSVEDLLARFGHDHGAAEIGPITARNPVGMMKRSIGNMWQAELHLLLSEPEKALPYEYEALKYLNLAREADRIYTRRLGFEPPPVSEERRLSGELDEILEYGLRETGQADDSDDRLFGRLFRLLIEHPPGAPFNADEAALLRESSQQMTKLAGQRPALITQAASLESLLVHNRLVLPDCPECLRSLEQSVWSLLPAAESGLQSGGAVAQPDDELAEAYLDALESGARP